LRADVAAFTATVAVWVRETVVKTLAEGRFVERELDAFVLEAVLDAEVLELAGLWAAILVAVVLWVAVFFDAAVFAVLAFVAMDGLVGVGFACEKATRSSGTLNIASARMAVIEVLRW
jgi:hypothetical protein